MSTIGSGWDLPPGSEPWSTFHWFQPTTRGVLVLVLLSERPVWYTGHFHDRRMNPCYGDECEFCKAGIGAQVRYCFGVSEDASRRVGLIEFGRSNGELLRDWQYRAGGLKGVTIEVEKHSRSAQSRTEIRYVDRPKPIWADVADCPDPALALYLTWHKAGLRIPSEFAAQMQLRALSLHNRRG